MRKLTPIVLVLVGAALLVSCNTAPKEKSVVMVVHHDRWGEVAPCG
jgi:hypothetical protein